MSHSVGVQLERADLIISMLDTQDWCSSERLANELGVSSKTVKRYMGYLRDHGYEIESKHGRGYRLAEPRCFGELRLTREELMLLCLVLMRAGDKFPERNVRRLRMKLLELASSRRQDEAGQIPVRRTVASGDALDIGMVAEIGRALERKKLLRLSYKGLKDTSPKHRRVQPKAFFHRSDDWYLEAWDFDSDKLKSFRLNRVEDVLILPQAFHALALDEEVETHPWSFGNEEVEVKLQVTPALAGWLRENPVHPKQRVEEKDGAWLIVFQVSSREKFLDWVIGLRGFRILAPADYVEALKARARVLADTAGTFDLKWELDGLTVVD